MKARDSTKHSKDPWIASLSSQPLVGVRVFVNCHREGYRGNGEVGNGIIRVSLGEYEGVVGAKKLWEKLVWVLAVMGFVCTMAEIGCNWARIGPSKSSQSLSNAHKWAAVIDWRGPFGLPGLQIIQLGFPAHQMVKIVQSIVFLSVPAPVCSDSSV
ncbi:hypothetical protein Tco_0158805 [Tanacetum coccineum]